MSENTLGLGLLRQPKTVLFGPGQRRQLPYPAKGVASHVLGVTDARMATSPEFAQMKGQLIEHGLKVSVFSETEPDLPRENVLTVVERFDAHTPTPWRLDPDSSIASGR